VKFEPHVRELEGLQVCSALYYEEESVVGRLVRPFKYSHQADLFRIFVPWMREALRLLGERGEVVFVPVPLHKSRELERGYNQSELLARWLASSLGQRLWKGLVRTRDTGSQARLSDRQSREENIKSAFEVAGAIPGYPIVLVDDIVTTGSTLLACSETLRAAGAKNIFALTLADREKKTNHWH
jgi:ComF family protein